jgi:TRAP-type C4-dicarboxylate transport system permease small subunit
VVAVLATLFDRAVRGSIAVLYGGLVLVGFAGIVARYVFNNSLSWSEELSLILMTWLVFITAAVGVQQRLHAGVDLVTSALPKRWQQAVGVLTDLLVTVFCIFLLVYGAQIVSATMTQTSPAMGLPVGIIYAAIPVGAALMLVNLFRHAANRVRRSNEGREAS